MAHQCQGVMRRVMKVPALQFVSEHAAEQQAAGAIGIVVRNENRVARIVVIEFVFLSGVFPVPLSFATA